MKRQIYASIKNPGTYVNTIGKFLYKNIDGAFKIEFHPMNCIVWMRMYYQLAGNKESFNEIYFMLDITSYQNKIRINITEDTLTEKTIGQIILTDDQIVDLNVLKHVVITKFRKAIEKEYSNYDFVY